MREEQAAYRCIVEELAKQICSGTLCQDAPLSSVSVIAKELSLRKRTVRSVIKSLKTMGVVETRKGKGDFLVGNVSEILSNLLHVMLLLQKISPIEVCQLRCAVDTAAYPLAFARRDELDLEELRELLEQIQLGSLLDIIAADQKSHQWLMKASGNQLMIFMMDSVWEICSTQMNLILCDGTEELHQKQKNTHEMLYKSFLMNDMQMGLRAIQLHYEEIKQVIKRLEERNAGKIWLSGGKRSELSENHR